MSTDVSSIFAAVFLSTLAGPGQTEVQKKLSKQIRLRSTLTPTQGDKAKGKEAKGKRQMQKANGKRQRQMAKDKMREARDKRQKANDKR